VTETDPTPAAVVDGSTIAEGRITVDPGSITTAQLTVAPIADPHVVLSLPDALDSVDAMRAAAPAVRALLIDRLRAEATAVRTERGTVVVPEDTYDLVRRLTAAGEVLRQWASAFTEAAKEADALTAEEALAVSGAELDGVLTASLFVPDGEGQRIAVRAEYGSRPTVWDVPSLVGWLVDDEVADARNPRTDDPDEPYGVDEVRAVARGVVDRLLALGKYEPQVTKVEALRKRLAEAGRDRDAGIIRQVRQAGAAPYKGVKVTREDAPAGRA